MPGSRLCIKSLPSLLPENRYLADVGKRARRASGRSKPVYSRSMAFRGTLGHAPGRFRMASGHAGRWPVRSFHSALMKRMECARRFSPGFRPGDHVVAGSGRWLRFKGAAPRVWVRHGTTVRVTHYRYPPRPGFRAGNGFGYSTRHPSSTAHTIWASKREFSTRSNVVLVPRFRGSTIALLNSVIVNIVPAACPRAGTTMPARPSHISQADSPSFFHVTDKASSFRRSYVWGRYRPLSSRSAPTS